MQSVVAFSVATAETIFHPITPQRFYGIARNRKKTAAMQAAFCTSATSDGTGRYICELFVLYYEASHRLGCPGPS